MYLDGDIIPRTRSRNCSEMTWDQLAKSIIENSSNAKNVSDVFQWLILN